MATASAMPAGFGLPDLALNFSMGPSGNTSFGNVSGNGITGADIFSTQNTFSPANILIAGGIAFAVVVVIMMRR